MFYRISLLIIVLNLSLFAKNPVSNIKLEKSVFEEQIAIDTLGIKSRKLIPILIGTTLQRGAILLYVNQITNTSLNLRKEEIVVVTPIPFKTSYLMGSASCEGSCQIKFSIDGGKSFDYGENLYVVYGKGKRVAMGSEYTHIQFIFASLSPLSQTKMAFKSRLK